MYFFTISFILFILDILKIYFIFLKIFLKGGGVITEF